MKMYSITYDRTFPVCHRVSLVVNTLCWIFLAAAGFPFRAMKLLAVVFPMLAVLTSRYTKPFTRACLFGTGRDGCQLAYVCCVPKRSNVIVEKIRRTGIRTVLGDEIVGVVSAVLDKSPCIPLCRNQVRLEHHCRCRAR